jgi:hypothetical protein
VTPLHSFVAEALQLGPGGHEMQALAGIQGNIRAVRDDSTDPAGSNSYIEQRPAELPRVVFCLSRPASLIMCRRTDKESVLC